MTTVLKRPTRRGHQSPHLIATDGTRLLVDPEDLWLLQRHRWKPYAVTQAGGKAYYMAFIGPTKVYLSHVIMGMPNGNQEAKGLVLTYLNGDPTDNRKANLAWVSESILRHRTVRKKRGGPNSSQYTGVVKDTRSGRWRASICADSEKIYIGLYREEVEAAKAYDREAIRLFGKFARLNFPLRPRFKRGRPLFGGLGTK